jgi:TRAP-type C4-dicarboxylate transport system permease small subunit
MKIFIRIFDKTIDCLAYISGLLVIFLIVIVGAEIIARKFLGFSIDWVVPLSGHAVFILPFFAAAWILKHKQHISTDVVVELLRARKRILIEIMNSIIGAGLCLFIAYRAGLSSLDLWQRQVTIITDDLGFLTSPFIAIMGLGMLLFSIQYMREAYENIKKWKAGSIKNARAKDTGVLEKPAELV